MLEALLTTVRATRRTCESVIVTTHPDNLAALALYESAGFARTGSFVGIEPVLCLDLAR